MKAKPRISQGGQGLKALVRVLLVCLCGCGGSSKDHLVAPERSIPGGGGNLPLPSAGIDVIYFTNDKGGISVRGNNAEYVLMAEQGEPLIPLLAGNGEMLAITQGGATPSLRIFDPISNIEMDFPLTSEPRSVAFSPNSVRVVFAASSPPYTLEVMSVDGTDRIELATSETPIDASWLPSGQQLVYTGTLAEGGVSQVFMVDADGQNRLQLTSGDRSKSHPAVSPEEGRLVF